MDTQTGLSDEQERMRLEGLRILARIIARHVVSAPDLYRDGPDGRETGPPPHYGQVSDGEPSERTDHAA